MSMEEPKKRLVSKEQYVGTIGAKGGLYSLACIFVCIGLALLLAAAEGAWMALRNAGCTLCGDFQRPMDWSERLATFVLAAFCGGLSVGAVCWAKSMVGDAQEMGQVTPITRHNTGDLPEVETFVRGSDRPAAAEQAELLRAVGHAPDTSPEQLLRAAQESRQDV